MKSLILALAMLLGLVVSAEATPGFLRRTPLNPFRGPVHIAPRFVPQHDFSRSFGGYGNFGARGFDGIRGDVLVTRNFRDRFGRLRVGLFDQFGNLVQIIR